MWASAVYLRWYKSFNARYTGPNGINGVRIWDRYGTETFPYVEIPLDRRLTTVVGANESGKSHLLSAIEKVLKGASTSESGDEDYAIHHVCRYCAIDGIDKDVWPNLGIEFTFPDQAERDACLAKLGLSATGVVSSGQAHRLRFFIDGQNSASFLTIYDGADARLGTAAKDQWFENAEKALPVPHMIDSRLRLSNHVHVSQLIDAYDGRQVSQAFEPLALQEFARTFVGMEIVKSDPMVAQLNELKQRITNAAEPLDKNARLETLLFRHILGVPKETLERIKNLTRTDRGYVERVVADINHRIRETLDLSQFWQQDDDFLLDVDYKAGIFFFQITDKTRAKYTFNERSSGLRYFLSYYIQAKAIKATSAGQPVILLFDEPDNFLSAAAQRNLLHVFETIVKVVGNKSGCQLIYTTHSPFLINRNYPSRISLIRKGDGSEGSQLVERAYVRRFEPVRSGLGVDCASTLFIGARNIVVEGVSDQRLLVAGIQHFGDPGRIDELLDLNRVTFVSAGGAPDVPRLIEESVSGTDRPPIVVTLLDGDAPGEQAANQGQRTLSGF